MRFVVDTQLPPALARWLTAKGDTAVHVDDIGLRDVDDSTIWTYALENDAVIITKDEDFPRRLRQTQRCPVVVWLRVGSCSRWALLEWLEPLLPDIKKLIRQGNRLIEIR